MALYYARLGTLRIYDSTEVLTALANASVFSYDDSTDTVTDENADARSAAASTFTFWEVGDDANDALFIGSTVPFKRITFDITTVAVGSGVLLPTYWNGSTWATLTATDGTASGGNTMAQDGDIHFEAPADWETEGGNSSVTGLTSAHYYIRLRATSIPSTAPIAEQGYAIDTQYFEVPFVQMDFKCPEGRPRPEETLVLDRENINDGTISAGHYVVTSERPIEEGVQTSFTAMIDDTTNRTALRDALEVGNPGSANWGSAGTSTKTDTTYIDIDGNTAATSAFVDTDKKTCAIQVIWNAQSETATSRIGRALNEVYIHPSDVEIAESEEGVTMSINGTVFGSIEEIVQFGYRH